MHGLNGHREKTWTASNNILWLRDLLPDDIPNARILSWGYDANTYSTSRLSAQYLYDHARTLVSDLSRKRQVTKVLVPMQSDIHFPITNMLTRRNDVRLFSSLTAWVE